MAVEVAHNLYLSRTHAEQSTHLNNILVVEMPQQLDFPQSAFGIHDIVKCVCDLFYCHLFIGPSMAC